jgi:heme/copper-type cytochrome/quinol oxidase subunit 1
MRNPGMSMHKLPLFAWAILVTAVLLLLSLPVLAGKIVPALNQATCWELFYKPEDNQQVTFLKTCLMYEWNFNDCAPELSNTTKS